MGGEEGGKIRMGVGGGGEELYLSFITHILSDEESKLLPSC